MKPATTEPVVRFVTKAAAARVLAMPVKRFEALVKEGHIAEARSYPGLRARFRLDDVLALKERYETPRQTG